MDYNKNKYILFYQKKDRLYNRIMDCELTFADKESIECFVEELRRDRNVLNYCIVSKECFNRGSGWNWRGVE